MATPRLTDELRWSTLGTWPFWRNLAVYFCVFSLVGHWLEIPYCMFMDQFGIVDDDSLVWDDPFYPFCVYGVGVVVCAVALLPLKNWLLRRCKTRARAGQRVDARDDLLDLRQAEPVFVEDPQAKRHQLVVVGLVARRARELGDAGGFGERDPDRGDQHAFQIETYQVHTGFLSSARSGSGTRLL